MGRVILWSGVFCLVIGAAEALLGALVFVSQFLFDIGVDLATIGVIALLACGILRKYLF